MILKLDSLKKSSLSIVALTGICDMPECSDLISADRNPSIYSWSIV